MDNKKLLIIFIPVVVLVFGYIFYSDYYKGNDNSEDKKVSDGSFVDVEIKRDTLNKSRRERYKDKWEKENALSRKIDNDDDFFGKEIKEDSVITSKKEMPDYTEPLEQQVETEPVKRKVKERIVTDKPKVVYVYKNEPKKEEVLPVESKIPLEEKTSPKRKVGFLTSGNQSNSKPPVGEVNEQTISINAVIQDESTVKSGSNVLIRITEDSKIGLERIPKNTIVYGVCSFTNERIKIDVNSIQVGNRTIHTKLKAFDLDGNEGLLVQGGIQQQVKKDVLNDVVSSASQVVNVPILRTLPSSAGNRTVNAPTIPLPKGHQLTLQL